MHEEAQKGCNVGKALQDAQLAAQHAKIACEAVEAEAQKARDLKLAEFKEACELRELELKAEQEKALSEAENVASRANLVLRQNEITWRIISPLFQV